MRKNDLSLMPARPADLPLIDRWLALPVVRRWWGDVVESRRDVHNVFAHRAGDAFPCLIMLKGVGAIGYVHVMDAQLFGKNWPDEVRQDVFDLDILIARQDLRARGIGTWAIKEVRRMVLREIGRESDPPPFMAWILTRNKRSRRAFAKAGYVQMKGLDLQKYKDWSVYVLESAA